MKRYDSYKDSRVQWLGEIPSHWDAIKISRVFSNIGSGTTPSSGSSEYYCDNGINWLQSGDLNDGYISETSQHITIKAVKDKNMKVYPKGSLAIAMYGATIGKLGILEIESTTNQACCIIPPQKQSSNIYLKFVFQSAKNYLLQQSNGGGQPNISQAIIKALYIPIPPLVEQETIVTFLEEKTGEIDGLVSKIECEIDLLKEYKQAEIARIVTKGLNPNVPMKSSGISWIGEMPAHWDVQKINQNFTERREKVSDKDFEPLSVTKSGVMPQLDTAAKTNNGDNRKRVCKGDFVVNSRSDRKGSCGFSQYDGSVSLINTVLIPRKNIFGRYYHYVFRSNDFIEEFYRLGRGIVADLWTTRYTEQRNIMIPVPPIEEQQKMVDFIDKRASKIDQLIEELTNQVGYLKEYKQRLIADVVTGKINVQPN